MNWKFGLKSLAVKLMAVSALAITTLMAVTFTLVIFKVRERAVAMIIEQAHTDAKATAETFSGKIATLAGATDFFAGTVAKGLEAGVVDRTALTAMLPSMIEKSTLIFGAWFMEPPFGFDGQAGPSSNPAMGTNSSGLFIPYWTRASSGLTLLRPDTPDYEAEYYKVPATTGKATATEPYVETNADNMLMMSITAPVRVKEKLHGVLGIDLGLGALAEALKNERPFGSGRVYLLSASGKWLTAPSDDLIMKAYASEGADRVREAMSKGEIATIENVSGGDGALSHRVIYPFDLPGLGTRWYIIEDVPVAAISAIVNEQTKVLVVGGVAVLLAVMFALYLAVRGFIQKPVTVLLGQVGRITYGDYNSSVSGQRRGDEIGALAISLETFRLKLAEGRELEQVAERERRDGDLERARTEEQRQSAVSTQRRVVEALGCALSRLSNGTLGYRIQDDFPDGYAELRDNFNSAAESLQNTILRFNATIHTLNAGTGEISRSTEQLSRRTEQQAASVEQTAAALNEISQKLNDSARNATLAANTVEGVCRDADNSGEIVNQAILAMERIDTSARQVSQIIGVIDEIAFQTNLLALNAGVEAARAGETGKGFAVVAQEVRELAQRSAGAAKQIKCHIQASGDQVRQGVALVGQTGEALGRIAEQVQAINGLIQNISFSAKEQASGLREINVAVSQMDEVTQQNAAMVEETTAASSILHEEAISLRDLIMGFDLENHWQAQSVAEVA